jgi:hypothetical protein
MVFMWRLSYCFFLARRIIDRKPSRVNRFGNPHNLFLTASNDPAELAEQRNPVSLTVVWQSFNVVFFFYVGSKCD